MTESDFPRQTTRRTLSRVGVWSVPAVSLAVAAPAFATVSGNNTMTITGVGPAPYKEGADPQASTLWTITVKNTSTATISGRTLQVVVPSQPSLYSTAATSSNSAWITSYPSGSVIFTYQGSLGPGASTTPSLGLLVARRPCAPQQTIPVSAMANTFKTVTTAVTDPYPAAAMGCPP